MKMAKRVLIVEDRPSWQTLLRTVFETAGWQVVGIAAGCTDALRLNINENPDLITIDGNLLAGEKGLDLAKVIRAGHSQTAIIMVADGWLQFEGHGVSKSEFGHGAQLLALADQLCRTKEKS